MKFLVTGGRGQLGRAVVRRGTAAGHTVASPDIDELDICDAASVERALLAATPDLVINAAAYTAVDKAESERDLAFKVNRDGAGVLAASCRDHKVKLLAVSTDYVFDGKTTEWYREDDPIAPLGVYGASKAEGDVLVRERGGAVVRTSWLFEAKGPSFVHTMLRLAKDRPVLRVVADQHGCPTWADDLADGLFVLAPLATAGGIYHYVNDGATTWHAFATEIIELGRKHASLACERIDAITTAEYPTPAKRPGYSILDTSKIRALGITPPSWRPALAQVVSQIFAQEKT
jgi:dTDP-4-dehydrorhamnose reductase